MKIRADVEYQEVIPRFHLPVQRMEMTRKIRCYVYPLALVILPWKILCHATHIFWRDLFYWNEDILEQKKGRIE